MAKYRCTYCQNVILTCRIKCAQCQDFDLCLQCFACGVEAGSHKKDHDYQAFDENFSIVRSAKCWLAVEEESLLEAVEQYGFGNWEDVAGHVKTKKSDECKKHYYAYYIHGNIGEATFPKESERKTAGEATRVTEGGSRGVTVKAPFPPVELSLPEQQQLGYMPLRDDFEREYDNDAETIVSSLTLNYDDDDLDIEFKLAQVDMYRQRLKERQRRKEIAHKFKLIANVTAMGGVNGATGAGVANGGGGKRTPTKRRLSKDDRDITERIRGLGQFHSFEEHQQFLMDIQKEKRIKAKIKELMKYRRNGVTKLDECTKFDEERVRREKKKENKKKMGNLNFLKRTSTGSKKAGEKQEENTEDIITESGAEYRMSTRATLSFSEQDLLSERERKLCHSIAMKPASYITIKTCIIRDYLRRRQGVPVKIRYPNHLDKTHRRKILSFLSENGWIGGISAS